MTPYTLNLIDLAFTLHALSNGGVELNPLMACVPVQIFYKIVIVGFLCWWLEKRPEPIAHKGLNLLAAVYVAANFWHIANLI